MIQERRKLTRIAFSTLGCKVNQYDTALIQSSVSDTGDFTTVPFDNVADIYVINTCTVTGKGDSESRRLIRKAQRQNKKAKIIVTGCYAQINPKGVAGISGVSMVLGNEEKLEFKNYLSSLNENPDDHRIFVGDIFSRDKAAIKHYNLSRFPSRTRAFLRVQDGCDSRCSYCIVPLARGNSRSLAPSDIIKQVNELSQKGYKEVVLCGVHLGGYGRDISNKLCLSSLVKRILTGTDIQRFRLSSIEPREITDELIDLVASDKRICRHFHIPLQSGDDFILRRMNRNYTAGYFEDLVLKVKEKMGDAGIGCDVMVGYPGEDEDHFKNTCRFIEGLPLTYLHVFSYSPRPGTAAYHIKETVKGDVKRKRSDILRMLGEKKHMEFINRYMGESVHILIEEEMDETTGLLKGYTGNYLKVLISPYPGFTKVDENPPPLSPLPQGEGRQIPAPPPLMGGGEGEGEKGEGDKRLFSNEIVKVHLSGIVNGSISGELLSGYE